MQRDVIEHPDYIPEKEKAKQDLRAGSDRGRIWRITPKSGLKAVRPSLGEAKVPTLVVTRGPAGATAFEQGERIDIPAAPLTKLVDTTGAGDLFAAGFLTARCKGFDLQRQLWTGAIAAAEVISHFGARPEADLKALVAL